MLMRVIALILMSLALSANSMQDDQQRKIDFCKVAAHLGFNVDSLKFQYSKSGKTMYVCQDFGPGWILLRLREGQFKIGSCAVDHKQWGVPLNNYQQQTGLHLTKLLSMCQI